MIARTKTSLLLAFENGEKCFMFYTTIINYKKLFCSTYITKSPTKNLLVQALTLRNSMF